MEVSVGTTVRLAGSDYTCINCTVSESEFYATEDHEAWLAEHSATSDRVMFIHRPRVLTSWESGDIISLSEIRLTLASLFDPEAPDIVVYAKMEASLVEKGKVELVPEAPNAKHIR